MPPNILWLSFEDFNPRLGCYGDRAARTPNIDRLAAEGCLYRKAFSTAPVSAPARAAVITGTYAAWMGAHHMRTTHTNRHAPEMPTPYACVPPPEVKCFSEYLRAAGYYCTNNTKTDYQFDAFGNVPFTAWDNDLRPASAGHWLEFDLLKHHWRNRAPGQPFFSVFNFTASHESCMWPGTELKTDPDSLELPPYLADTPETRRALARHYDRVAENDAFAGQLLAQLEEDGLADNTIVFHWSDHGAGLPRAKRWLYDSGIRVPLVVRFPKAWHGRDGVPAPGTVSDELVSTLDLAPTVLSLCGVARPTHLQGNVFLGPGRDAPREHVFAARDRMDENYDRLRAVRDGRWKYIRNAFAPSPRLHWLPYAYRHPAMQDLLALEREGRLNEAQRFFFQPRPPEELYDTENDPHEIRNLAEDPARAGDLRRLRAAMDDWCAKFDRFAGVDETTMVRRWQPEGRQQQTATPLILPVAEGHDGGEPMEGEATFAGPVLLMLHCATEGASIGWTTDPGPDARWNLYAGPLRFGPGESVTLRVKAIRYGYKESAERVASLSVSGVRG